MPPEGRQEETRGAVTSTLSRVLRVVIAGAVAVGVALLGLEMTFRGLLVDPVVPRSARALRERVSSGWPRPIDDEPAEGTFRIVAIGDSFGLYGGHDNFNYMLERRLRRRYRQVELVNLSLPAIELHDQLRLWLRHGARFEPDLVVHGLFVGNDLLTPEGELVEFGGIVMRRIGGIGSWHPRQWLLKRWWDRRAIVRRDARARAEESSVDRGPAHRPDPVARVAIEQAGLPSLATTAIGAGQGEGTFSEREFLRIERQRLEVSGRSPEWRSRRAAALEMIDTMRRDVEATGARYVLVIHPDQFQVETGLRERLAVTYGIDIDGAYDMDMPQRQILAHCETIGAACIDLLPSFREAGSGGGLYLQQDTHYNHAGNQLAAQRVLAYLEREGLVPTSVR